MTFSSGSSITRPVVEDTQEEGELSHQQELAFFEGLLNEIVQRRRRIKRSPDEEPKRKVPLKEGLLESVLGKSIASKSETSTRDGSLRGETVGSLLATIPGILEVHEQSYDNIGDQISSIGSGLIAAIKSVGEKMTSVGETMHQDSEKMHQEAEEMNNKLEKLDKTQHDGMHALMSSLSDEDNNINGLTEALHDGLHDLSEQIGSKSDVSQVITFSFLDNSYLVTLEKVNVVKLWSTILFQILHDGLDMISMKMPEKNHLEEAVHDGFDSLVESLSDRDELGSIIHDGLHDLSEQIGAKSDVSQVLSH